MLKNQPVAAQVHIQRMLPLNCMLEVFEAEDALDKLEAFASLNGPAFYGLPVNNDEITLEKSTWDVPETMAFGSDVVVPIRAGEQIAWKVKGE